MRLAVVASGWHFPLHFYQNKIKIKGWDVDYFCVSHRKPILDKDIPVGGIREQLDQILYRELATEEKIKDLGWNYKLYPNTIGDWGCSNQWLEDNNYKDYDLLLFTHDDNIIINPNMIDTVGLEFDVLANSAGMPPGHLRGSFEFFKPKVIELLGGKFDLSETTLTREGKTDTPTDKESLYDWNTTVYPTMRALKQHSVQIKAMSPYYRVSPFCIEGERGYISYTHGMNTDVEDAGFTDYKQIINQFIYEN